MLVGGLDQGVKVLQLLGRLLLVGVAQQVWEDGLVVTQVVTNWHSYWLALSCAREIQASTVQEIIRCRCFPVSQLRKPLPCLPGSVNLGVVSGVSVIRSARTSCTMLLPYESSEIS